MNRRIARAVISACLVFGGTGVLGAQEHKAPEKKDAAHGEAKPAEKKEAPKEAAKEHEAKPTPAPKPPETHATPAVAPKPPTRPPALRAARPRRAAAEPVPTATASPVREPVPVVVEVKQEPAKVEAVLRVVPYGPDGRSGYGVGNGASYGLDSPVRYGAELQTVAEAVPPRGAPEPRAEVAEANEWDLGPPPPAAAPLAVRPLRAPRNTLTNEGLVVLAQAGYDEDFLIELMRLKRCRFDTSVDGLRFLARYGLSERVIKEVLRTDMSAQAER